MTIILNNKWLDNPKYAKEAKAYKSLHTQKKKPQYDNDDPPVEDEKSAIEVLCDVLEVIKENDND